MPDQNAHTSHVQSQFTRQAQAYANTEQASDLRGMSRLAGITNANRHSITLDVACGPGRLTMAFAERVKHATGIDATEALLEIARSESSERRISNIDFANGTALDLPFPETAFDIVSCRAAFHHFDAPDAVLSEMTRVTKHGGQLLIADILGNEDASTGRHHDDLERLCDPAHVRCLTATQFNSLFASADLEITNSWHRKLSYDVDGWIKHGGPPERVAAEIRRAFKRNLHQDGTGLAVREEDGELRFSHQTVVFLLAKQSV